MKLTGLVPMLETEDLKATIRFYDELLGFRCEGTFPDADKPGWASLRRDNVWLMFTVRNAHATVAKPMMTGSLYLYPDNVDEMWEHLQDKAAIEYPIENFDYGMREFAIRDCNGYLIQFGQDIQEQQR